MRRHGVSRPWLTPRLRADDKNTEDEEEQNLFMVKFEHHLLENVALQGIRNVRKVFMRQEESTIPNPQDSLLGYERRKEWLLDSEGINLAEVLQADNVDATRTLSNHVVEMFEVLGIEAARLSVLKELRAVLEFDGSKVNYRCAPCCVLWVSPLWLLDTRCPVSSRRDVPCFLRRRLVCTAGVCCAVPGACAGRSSMQRWK